jgi:hypothetical protein
MLQLMKITADAMLTTYETNVASGPSEASIALSKGNETVDIAISIQNPNRAGAEACAVLRITDCVFF